MIAMVTAQCFKRNLYPGENTNRNSHLSKESIILANLHSLIINLLLALMKFKGYLIEEVETLFLRVTTYMPILQKAMKFQLKC